MSRSSRLAVVVLLLFCACEKNAAVEKRPAAPDSPPGTEASVALQGSGSTFVNPIMQRWIAAYGDSAKTRVAYDSVGSSEGVRQITAREVDFGASDVAMSDEELARAPSPIVQVPLTLGSVVIAYNRRELADRLKLSKEAISGIFLGDIKKWNDARIAKTNPDVRLPDLDIMVVVRSDGSGTTGVFTRYLAEVSPRWRTEVGAAKNVRFPVGKVAPGNEGVARELSRTAGAVGYVELAYAIQGDLGLGYAFAENPAGRFVEPSIETATAAAERAVRDMPEDLRVSLVNVQDEDAYPLASCTFAMAYQSTADEIKGRALAQFLWWVVHDGQKLAPALFYAPLPAELIPRIEQKLKGLRIGAHFAIQ